MLAIIVIFVHACELDQNLLRALPQLKSCCKKLDPVWVVEREDSQLVSKELGTPFPILVKVTVPSYTVQLRVGLGIIEREHDRDLLLPGIRPIK